MLQVKEIKTGTAVKYFNGQTWEYTKALTAPLKVTGRFNKNMLFLFEYVISGRRRKCSVDYTELN